MVNFAHSLVVYAINLFSTNLLFDPGLPFVIYSRVFIDFSINSIEDLIVTLHKELV